MHQPTRRRFLQLAGSLAAAGLSGGLAAGLEPLQVRDAANRARSANNLKQIMIAIHNYHDVHRQFPPQAVCGSDGKPLLSWRVLLLPYLEQETLFKQLKLDEPWDSSSNIKLLETIPATYAPVGVTTKEKGGTFYQAFVGNGAIMDPKEKLTLASVTDGTSNTIFVVEAGEPVPWTKPADLDYDPKKPLPKLGGLFKGDFNAAFADGSVRFLRKDLNEKTLRALITRGGNEVVNLNQLK